MLLLNNMVEIPIIPTERTSVTLRQLSNEADDAAYFAAIDANRAHLSQFDDNTANKYRTLEDVTTARLNAGSKIRMGIWDGDTFVGTVNATPNKNGTEIGYWLDSRHTGHGYATLAAKALGHYVAGASGSVYAEVADGNEASVRVLERAGYTQVAENAGRLIFALLGTPEIKPRASVSDIVVSDIPHVKPILETWVRDSDTGEILEDEITSIIESMYQSIGNKKGKQFVVARDASGNVTGVMGMDVPGEDIRRFTKTSNPVELVNAFVDPSQRGLGTGNLLATSLEEKAVDAGYTEIVVNSGPRYKATGWKFWTSRYGEPIAIQENLYGPGADAPVWIKSLVSE